MTFLEAAISLLNDAGKPVEVSELAQLAVDRDLLDRPGKNPLGSMKSGLTREAKKGKEARVEQVSPDVWALRGAGAKKSAKSKTSAKGKTSRSKAATATKAESQKTPKTTTSASTSKTRSPGKKTAARGTARKSEAAAEAEQAAPRKTRSRKKAAPTRREEVVAEAAGGEVVELAARAEAAPQTAEAAPEGRSRRTRRKQQRRREAAKTLAKAPEAVGDAADITPEARVDAPVIDTDGPPTEGLEDVLAPRKAVVRAVAEVPVPDEQDAVDLYGDELEATAPGEAFAEYHDEQTADEDRPMMPEIVSERLSRRDRMRRDRREQRRGRRRRGERGERGERRDERGERRDERGERRDERGERRDERGERRDERGERRDERRPDRGEARGEARDERRPRRARELPPVVDALAEVDVEGVVHRPGTTVGRGAIEALVDLGDRQPVPVKQLAQMMRKRGLLDGEPEELWPHLKATLLADAESYRNFGLQPRVAYRGRDLFALHGGPGEGELGRAEASFARAIAQLAAATHRTLKARVSQLTSEELERIAHAYLLRAGWRGIKWIKRVPHASYATAEPLGVPGTVLVGVWGGDERVPRRGVGELRAGVEAKRLTSGLLIAPQELSEDAHAELARGGKPVATLVGDALIAALIDARIGVVSASAPVFYLDEDFFREVF